MWQKPSIGASVHYTSHGTPFRPDGGQAYPAQCRAAIITETGEKETHVGLCVLNPSGIFLRTLAEGGCSYDKAREGGTWHWPERACSNN